MPVAPSVSSVVSAYPPAAQQRFEDLRDLIFAEAERLEVGPLTETLKWGQPAYLTASGAGTTVRLHWSEKLPDTLQVLVHCQSSLVKGWRQAFGDALEFDGNRAVHVSLARDYPAEIISQCFAAALTYHQTR